MTHFSLNHAHMGDARGSGSTAKGHTCDSQRAPSESPPSLQRTKNWSVYRLKMGKEWWRCVGALAITQGPCGPRTTAAEPPC